MDTKATTNRKGKLDGKKLVGLFRDAANRYLKVKKFKRRNFGRFYKLLMPIIRSQLIQYRREAKNCKELMECQHKTIARKLRILIFNHIQSLS